MVMFKDLICRRSDLLNQTFTRRFRIFLPWLVLSLIFLLQAITPAVAISQTPADPTNLRINDGTTSTATGNTFYVGTKGSDNNSCNAAQNSNTPKRNIMGASGGLACLSAGDTLYLREGTYVESINSTNQTIPVGTSWSNAVTIASHPSETATLKPTGTCNIINFSGNTHQYIILDRLVLDGADLCTGGVGGTYTSNALSLIGAHHIRFQNGEMKNGEGPLVTMFDFDRIDGSNEVLDSSIHDAQFSYGFYISTQNNLIKGNEIYNNGGYGIQIYSGYPGSNQTDNTIVRDNVFYGNGFVRGGGFGAIIAGSGDNIQIYNNQIYENQNGIGVAYGNPDNTQIFSNTIHNNTTEGVVINPGVTNTVVKENHIYQNNPNLIDKGIGTVIFTNSFTP